MKAFSVLARGTSQKEYSCQEKETNFILLNHQISQKKLQASSCKKLQMDRPHRELLLHRYSLLQPGQPSSAIFLWSWPTQWNSLLLGNPVIVSAFCSWAALFSQTLFWELCKWWSSQGLSPLPELLLSTFTTFLLSPNLAVSSWDYKKAELGREPRRWALVFPVTAQGTICCMDAVIHLNILLLHSRHFKIYPSA